MLNERQIKLLVTILNAALGIAITIVLLLVNKSLTFPAFLANVLTSFVIGVTTGYYIPALPLGMQAADKLGFKPTSLMHYVVTVTVLALIMSIFISVFSMLITFGPTAAFVGAWTHLYPIILLSAFVAILILLRPAMMISGKAFVEK